ncbi:MAG: alpha/beta hydrolase [Telluria sp.]
MRSVIPTRSSRAPSALQTATLLGIAGLAVSLLYVKSKASAAEREHPPRGRFVEVDGVRLHYGECGEGPALVLLHGNGLMSDEFDLNSLHDNAYRPYRLIAFDRPGFGYSERPGTSTWTPEEQARLFYKALHQMGVERPIVVGHSGGALVALSMALNFPKYVRAITLVSGYYYPSPLPGAALLSASALPGIGHLLRYTVAPLLGRMLWPRIVKHLFAPAPVPERFAQLPKWLALRPSQLAASSADIAMMVPSAARLSARYRELTLPVAIIAGLGDKIVRPDQNALRLHDEVAHSELIVEDDVGHMAHHAHPVRLMAAVERLEASLTPGGTNLRHSSSVHRSAVVH